MTSRLDRLFILLESGTAAVTRRAAAKQIGEVQKLHPHELHNLLRRLIGFLHNTSWETRVAASQAIEAILANVPQWDPQPVADFEGKPPAQRRQRITFENFNLERVLENGEYLMGSSGTEFDLPDDLTEESCAENIQRQQEMLNEKLGLSKDCTLHVLGMGDLVSKADLMSNLEKPTDLTCGVKRTRIENILENLHSSPKNQSHSDMTLSCREKNRARRKARQGGSGSTAGTSKGANRSSDTSTDDPMVGSANQVSTGLKQSSNASEPAQKKQKLRSNSEESLLQLNEAVPDATGNWVDATEWPLESFSGKLHLDLFNPRWEIRHGAATALRELLKSHANGAGKCVNMTADEIKESHQQWMEECAIKLLCVLALDRFGDFVSDQVVAPVRETCAQALGIVLKELPPERVHITVNILMSLITENVWEVRHGGLLGLKYVLVVRNDLVSKFLPMVLSGILNGLFDEVDDVGAVAASTLVPIAPMIPKLLTAFQVCEIIKMVWELLSDQDELTSACNSFMSLLAAFLSLPDVSSWINVERVQELVPRLWPFLLHNSSSVRRSTLQTLLTLTSNMANMTSPTNGAGSSVQKRDVGVCQWPPQLLQETMRHIFQRALVEPIEDIQEIVESVWKNLLQNAELSSLLYAACPYVASWMCFAMQPAKMPFVQSNWLTIKSEDHRPRRSAARSNPVSYTLEFQQKIFLGGSESTPAHIRDQNVIKSRCRAARMLGMLSKYLVMNAPGVVYTPNMESPTDCYTKVLLGYLHSRSSLQRMIAGIVISYWAINDSSVCPGPELLGTRLNSALCECTYYEENAHFFTRLLSESCEFVQACKQYDIKFPTLENCEVYTIDQIKLLCTTMTENFNELGLHKKDEDNLEEKRRKVHSLYIQTSNDQNFMALRTQAVLSGAVVCLKCLPDKLNPIIKPLMESIKNDDCELLQGMSAFHLVRLLDQIRDRDPCPNNKIIQNICTVLRADPAFTPDFNHINVSAADCKLEGDSNPFIGILTLKVQQKIRGPTNNGTRGPGRPPICDFVIDELDEDSDEAQKKGKIKRIGATGVITEMCKLFQGELPQKVPQLWITIFYIASEVKADEIEQLHSRIPDKEATKEIMHSLQVIEVAVPSIHDSLYDELHKLFPALCVLLKHPYKCVRHLAARCLSVLASRDVHKAMCIVMDKVLPMLQLIENVIYRQGAAEAMTCLVTALQLKIVPYAVMLVVPLLGRMSDIDESVRLVSTNCFATLIQLMQLDSPSASPLALELQEKKEKDREFLEYLFSPKNIPDFKIPVMLDAELRSYQQAGINWLWFLNRYNLHGILCDDMGLGKTLQTIGILCGDHWERDANNSTSLPSLVICPPTLTGHWVFEVNKFIPNKYIDPMHYVGLPYEREKLRSLLPAHNLVVASYDIVRKDIEFFSSVNWNYCVLDEGHVIKNGKTKSSQAIKKLVANHRLILSGTPIQNNVLELWSLFDFLMPGFLGTERQFMNKYSRPIVASRDPKSSAKEQEAGALAMEALHRQVLPFLLRRVKEDVLTDLPPKITQDLLCDLSPLQQRLYEDFSRTRLSSDIKDCLSNLDATPVINSKKTHVFQALRYLQNVCNHPKLVLNSSHPEYASIQFELANQNHELDSIDHSAKLPVLKQLLLDCGIGVDNVEASVNQHRALIFCQLKAMLDILENDFLKKHLPDVTYMRLDGTVPASERHTIVNKFNRDPSIDVLILTTQVGGLGLNLTGADTVIFVEHDWNPMKDLQAMDRAHRIGQRKVVNVYRLITRNSLEEKIMGLQKFKLVTANTIVSDANSSVETMGTDQLLNLFDLTEDQYPSSRKQTNSSCGKAQAVLASLPELWDDKQYEDEYDLTQFLQNLKKV